VVRLLRLRSHVGSALSRYPGQTSRRLKLERRLPRSTDPLASVAASVNRSSRFTAHPIDRWQVATRLVRSTAALYQGEAIAAPTTCTAVMNTEFRTYMSIAAAPDSSQPPHRPPVR
jgi:hypothetical protein